MESDTEEIEIDSEVEVYFELDNQDFDYFEIEINPYETVSNLKGTFHCSISVCLIHFCIPFKIWEYLFRTYRNFGHLILRKLVVM